MGGGSEVLPLNKGGGGRKQVLAMLKSGGGGGGTTSFEVVLTQEFEVLEHNVSNLKRDAKCFTLS